MRWSLKRNRTYEASPGKLSFDSAFDRSRPLAFMHIPKTSGTALTSALASGLEPCGSVRGFDRSLFGSFRQFDTIDASERERIYHAATHLRAKGSLITGHFAFSTLRQAYPNAQIMTVLRDPISRLVSHWMYWRQNTDAMLSSWGSWGDIVRFSRQPLASFLDQPLVACQTDNLALRMLLWPHPLIKDDQFIEPRHDETLLSAALEILTTVDFVDFIENVNFVHNLERWMGQTLAYGRENETCLIPVQFRNKMHLEFTPEAYELLRLRSRLDLELWQNVVTQRLPGCNATALRERTTLAAVARYSALMALD